MNRSEAILRIAEQAAKIQAVIDAQRALEQEVAQRLEAEEQVARAERIKLRSQKKAEMLKQNLGNNK